MRHESVVCLQAQTAAGVIHNPDEPITTPVTGRNTEVTERGRLLANMAFRFKDLDVQYQAFLEDVASAHFLFHCCGLYCVAYLCWYNEYFS